MRRTPLKRTDGFRHGEAELVSRFRLEVVGHASRCLMQGRSRVSCSGPFDPCHVIAKGSLRDRNFSEEVVYDPRNGVCACRRHHLRNDAAIERFPRWMLPSAVDAFAAEHELEWLLERMYGE